VVIDAERDDDAKALDRILEAWYEAIPEIGGVDYWHTAADPDIWDWALPSAEALARQLLAGRHQCADHPGPCCCDLRGVMFPADARAKHEAGHLVRPGRSSSTLGTRGSTRAPAVSRRCTQRRGRPTAT
jgi:hypothetical protein